jgi:hypothetical protein
MIFSSSWAFAEFCSVDANLSNFECSHSNLTKLLSRYSSSQWFVKDAISSLAIKGGQHGKSTESFSSILQVHSQIFNSTSAIFTVSALLSLPPIFSLVTNMRDLAYVIRLAAEALLSLLHPTLSACKDRRPHAQERYLGPIYHPIGCKPWNNQPRLSGLDGSPFYIKIILWASQALRILSLAPNLVLTSPLSLALTSPLSLALTSPLSLALTSLLSLAMYPEQNTITAEMVELCPSRDVSGTSVHSACSRIGMAPRSRRYGVIQASSAALRSMKLSLLLQRL